MDKTKFIYYMRKNLGVFSVQLLFIPDDLL